MIIALSFREGRMSSASPLETSTVSFYSGSARRPELEVVRSVRPTLDNDVPKGGGREGCSTAESDMQNVGSL